MSATRAISADTASTMKKENMTIGNHDQALANEVANDHQS